MRRLGRFEVEWDDYKNYKLLLDIQQDCAIIDCRFLGHMNKMEYYAYNEAFDIVPDATVVPDYEVTFTTVFDGQNYVKAFKEFIKC